MFRLFLLFVLFYVLYKGIKLFFKYFISEMKKPADNIKDNGDYKAAESKYKDVEEAEFIEIKSDSKNQKEKV
jgi:hypothetical protein